MLDKISMDKIASYYYDLGVGLALQEAGLAKIAEPKKPKVQKMTMPAMEVKPSESFKQIKQIPGSTHRDTAMREYLRNRRTNESYDNAGIPKSGPQNDKLMDRAFQDPRFAEALSKRLSAGDPG